MPPKPDLTQAVERKFTRQGATISYAIYRYMYLLSLPFFLFSLGYFKKFLWIPILLFLFRHYILYVDKAYVSRNEMASLLIVVFCYLWITGWVKRKVLLPVAVIGSPLMLWFFSVYTYIRQGNSFYSAFVSG